MSVRRKLTEPGLQKSVRHFCSHGRTRLGGRRSRHESGHHENDDGNDRDRGRTPPPTRTGRNQTRQRTPPAATTTMARAPPIQHHSHSRDHNQENKTALPHSCKLVPRNKSPAVAHSNFAAAPVQCSG